MTGISRYEKIALGATTVFAVLCLAVLIGSDRGNGGYTVTATETASNVQVLQSETDGVPDSLLPGEKIDLNTAPEEELRRLPGIGEKRAADIVAWRETQGKFTSIEELVQVSGIGQGTFDAIANYITVSEE